MIGFSDEEGVRFHTTFIGSKAVTGKFGKDLLTDAVDKQGVPLGVVLGVVREVTPCPYRLRSILTAANSNCTTILSKLGGTHVLNTVC